MVKMFRCYEVFQNETCVLLKEHCRDLPTFACMGSCTGAQGEKRDSVSSKYINLHVIYGISALGLSLLSPITHHEGLGEFKRRKTALKLTRV